MLELTGALRAELQRMQQQAAEAAAPIRITRHPDGTFAFGFDARRDGDVVIDAGAGSPPVVIARALADDLDGAILHFRRTGEDYRYGDAGLVLLQHRGDAPRGQWAPPGVPSTAHVPIWTRARRRFGAAHPRTSATQTAGL